MAIYPPGTRIGGPEGRGIPSRREWNPALRAARAAWPVLRSGTGTHAGCPYRSHVSRSSLIVRFPSETKASQSLYTESVLARAFGTSDGILLAPCGSCICGESPYVQPDAFRRRLFCGASMDQIIAHTPDSVKGLETAIGADAFGFGMRPEKRQGGGRQDRDLTGFPKPVT